MTKAEAIQQLLNCEWLDNACRNINKSNWEDLRQDFWAKILEQPESTFTAIRNLQFFCVRIIINSNTDKFRRQKPLNIEPETEQPDIEQELHAAMQRKNIILGTLPPYDRIIYKLHERGISCRRISEFTKINRNEVNATVNRVKNYIAQNVKYQPTGY